MKLALGMLVMAPFCLADQTAYSDFCRTADIDNGIPNIYCFAGQQLFDDAPRPFPNTLPLSGQLVSVTLKLAWSASSVDGASDNQPHALGIGSVFYRKRGASMYCYFGTQTLLADGGWHDVTFDTASAIDPNTSTHTSNCDLDFATETLDYIELNHGGVVGAWTDTNIYTDGISQQANTCGGNCISPNHSLWFTIGTTPKPIVIVVPGFGASTLTDANGTNQWLSCSSILALHVGDVRSVAYDSNGNPGGPSLLAPTEILTESDAVSDTVRPSTQSLLECNNSDLAAMAIDSNVWGVGLVLKCFTGFVADPHECAQTLIAANARGALLQFNNLLSALALNGYSPVSWPYDFRKDLSALADDLYARIEQLASQNPGRLFSIVTHSMGTLVTAAMIQQHPDVYDSGLLKTIVSMGAPFSGSIKTYIDAQGWEGFPPFLSGANTKAMGSNWTSVYQLLPQWDFVTRLSPPFPTKYDIFNGTNDPSHFPPLPRAPIIPQSTNPASLWNRIANLGPLNRWYNISGYGQPTHNQITERLNVGNYRPCLTIEEGDGDGTVPLRSSQAGLIVPAQNEIYVKDEHAALPGNSYVISGVLSLLGGTFPVPSISGLASSPPPFTPQDIITINACSPVTVSVTDSAGNSVSSQVLQIPQATFTNIGDMTQIQLPWNGTFQVVIVGTGTGSFDLLVNGLGGQHAPLSYFFKGVPVQKESTGTVTVGGTSTPTLQYNYAGKSVVDTIPANVTPPTIVCTGCYLTIQNLRATLAFNIGYQGGASTFTYNYRSTSQRVQFASTITSHISLSTNSATFSGRGTLNGQPGYNFTVTATDGGAAGSGLDTISIAITGPSNYSYIVTGPIAGGDVVVHQ